MHGSDPLDLQVVRGDEGADEEHAEDAKTPSADGAATSAKMGPRCDEGRSQAMRTMRKTPRLLAMALAILHLRCS
jgi:hypothetical protein